MNDVASVMVNSRINTSKLEKQLTIILRSFLLMLIGLCMMIDAPIVVDLVEVGEASGGGANELRFLMLMKMDMEMSLMRMKIIWRMIMNIPNGN
ncbi:hypothetical protein L195_g000752 [Trifolium pratense]|uniref:Uncharacterized protein n=1 Tax=Trifolium pratense TaxID=57577 RepID=A0A2K3NMR8_TRIPR|nr:hypothetical protein L195_g000752 [Trifolium pratense]